MSREIAVAIMVLLGIACAMNLLRIFTKRVGDASRKEGIMPDDRRPGAYEYRELQKRLREWAERVDKACPCYECLAWACEHCQAAMKDDPSLIHADGCEDQHHALAAEMRKKAGDDS